LHGLVIYRWKKDITDDERSDHLTTLRIDPNVEEITEVVIIVI
jgi:hypothetical protein